MCVYRDRLYCERFRLLTVLRLVLLLWIHCYCSSHWFVGALCLVPVLYYLVFFLGLQSFKVSKGAKIWSRYNQVPHPTQDTIGKVTNSQLDTTNESQEVSPFPAGDHKAHINRRFSPSQMQWVYRYYFGGQFILQFYFYLFWNFLVVLFMVWISALLLLLSKN